LTIRTLRREQAAKRRHPERRQRGAVAEAVPHAHHHPHGRARRHPDDRPREAGREPAGGCRRNGQRGQPVHLPHHEQGRAEHDDHPQHGLVPHRMMADRGGFDQHPPVHQHYEDRGAGNQEGRISAEALVAEDRHRRQGQEDRGQHTDHQAPDPQHAGHAAVQVIDGRRIGAVGGHTTHHASTMAGGRSPIAGHGRHGPDASRARWRRPVTRIPIHR
jgi:hypothetical protein